MFLVVLLSLLWFLATFNRKQTKLIRMNFGEAQLNIDIWHFSHLISWIAASFFVNNTNYNNGFNYVAKLYNSLLFYRRNRPIGGVGVVRIWQTKYPPTGHRVQKVSSPLVIDLKLWQFWDIFEVLKYDEKPGGLVFIVKFAEKNSLWRNGGKLTNLSGDS